jgi:O-antigen ligase
MGAPAADRIVSAPFVHLVADTSSMAVVLFANLAIFYFILGTLHIQFSNPAPIVALMVGLLFLGPKRLSLSACTALAAFCVLTTYFYITALWSPSSGYLAEKLEVTFVSPFLCLAMGYFVARSGRVVSCAYAILGLGVIAYITASITGAHLASVFVEGRRGIASYQQMSTAVGSAAGVAFILAASHRGWWARGALLATGVLLGYFATTTGGRDGIVVTAFGVIGLLLIVLPSRAAAVAVLAGGALAAVALLVGRMSGFLIWAAENRSLPLGLSRAAYKLVVAEAVTSAGDADRAYLQKAATRIFEAHPLFGVGWAGFPVAAGLPDTTGYYPHNILLEIMAETGAIGLVLTILFAWVACARYFRLARAGSATDRHLIWFLLASGVTYSMLIADWPSARALFLAFGLMVGFADRVELSGSGTRVVAPLWTRWAPRPIGGGATAASPNRAAESE